MTEHTQLAAASGTTGTRDDWWRNAVIYQVYIRSFADGDGDGLGDIAGLRAELDHIVRLGVDAIWINPWYPSPFADAGYDVSDYRDIDPRLGTLAGAEELIAEAHRRGLRVLLDIVPNHTSDQHAWFREALAAGPGSGARARYVFRDGRGPNGEEPPNDWRSVFHGPAWTRVTEADGTSGQWYLHLFASEQPDLNWHHPDVHADMIETLRFWFDRGADGFRIDVAHSLVKEEGLPDIADRTWARLPFRLQPIPGVHQTDHPHWDRDEVHEIYREWRRVADSYDPPRVFVAETWIPDPSRTVLYLRHDELHTAFNFDFLRSRWIADELRGVIDDTLAEHRSVGATATWVLSNHDVARQVSRFARRDQDRVRGHHLRDLTGDVDLDLGRRRAAAAALLMFALPGSCYVYQGEELGLAEVEDLPEDSLQDPTWFRSGGEDRGRDGCRVPLPWTSDPATSFGFSRSPLPAAPWLPQPAWFGEQSASAQHGVPGSMLELYRDALRRRRELPALGEGDMAWLDSSAGTLVFTREPGFGCVVNVSAEPVELPAGWTPVLASAPLVGGRVGADTAVWCAR